MSEPSINLEELLAKDVYLTVGEDLRSGDRIVIDYSDVKAYKWWSPTQGIICLTATQDYKAGDRILLSKRLVG